MAEENLGKEMPAQEQPEEQPVPEMSEESAEPTSGREIPTWPEPVAEQENVAETKAHRDSGSGGAWLGGFVLIALGAIFLLQNLTSWQLNNWWALFILIPAISSLANAWRAYRAKGRLDSGASGALTAGVIMLLVALVFLLNLSWGAIWPVFLIVIGVGALLGGMRGA